MKKLMTLILALGSIGIFAQSSLDSYASADDISNNSYTELVRTFSDEIVNAVDVSVLEIPSTYVSYDDILKVSDLLLADPEFDIQENMISYTKDQKTVYFSANRKIKSKKMSKTELKIKKSVQLQMFKANVSESGEWVNLKMLPFNGTRHSTGHPSLSVDDTKLYFVSDGPESTGKTDIFVVDLFEDGTYGKPMNLGSKINSAEREVFPMVDDSSVLYFASDVETEGNELSVFASELIDNEPTAPIKLDVQVTGSEDDYVAAYKIIDDQAKRIAEKEANLKDLEILLEAESLAEINRVEEVFADAPNGVAYDFTGENVVYTVQIGAFLKNVKTDNHNDTSVLFNHQYDDGYNRFYSGVFESSEEAVAHLNEMQKEGYQDAFVLGLAGKKRFLPD